MRRGDIFWADFDPALSGEANKIRPCIIVSNDNMNRAAERNQTSPVIVVPITKENLATLYPSHLLLPGRYTGLKDDSKAQVEALRSVSAKRIQGKKIGEVPSTYMDELDRLIKEVLGADETLKHLTGLDPF
jgi:mRNA interferase MazF